MGQRRLTVKREARAGWDQSQEETGGWEVQMRVQLPPNRGYSLCTAGGPSRLV